MSDTTRFIRTTVGILLAFALLMIICTAMCRAARGQEVVMRTTAGCYFCELDKPHIADLAKEGWSFSFADGGAEQYPTFVVLSGRKELGRFVGYQTPENLRCLAYASKYAILQEENRRLKAEFAALRGAK